VVIGDWRLEIGELENWLVDEDPLLSQPRVDFGE
jgi:hypothetical protein